jgi:hypothetical protein
LSQEPDEDPLKRLLFDTVEGIEELEILCWFAKGNECGDAETVARDIALPTETVRAALERLTSGGLLQQSSENPKVFRVDADPEAKRVVLVVTGEYRANPVRVMKLMTQNAIERVRTAALRTFAESFRIRKRPRNG